MGRASISYLLDCCIPALVLILSFHSFAEFLFYFWGLAGIICFIVTTDVSCTRVAADITRVVACSEEVLQWVLLIVVVVERHTYVESKEGSPLQDQGLNVCGG